MKDQRKTPTLVITLVEVFWQIIACAIIIVCYYSCYQPYAIPVLQALCCRVHKIVTTAACLEGKATV